ALSGTSPTWYLYGGTIQGGTISTSNGAALVATYNSNNTLSGVTLAGTLDMTETSSSVSVTVTGGLTLNNGTIELGSTSNFYNGILSFKGAQTLGGTGSVVLGESS